MTSFRIRRRGEPRFDWDDTHPIDGAPLHPGQSAVIFEGASEIGVMPAGVVAIKDWGRDTQPLAWLSNQRETRPGA